jgi:regulator of replication initiation timing
LKPGISNRGLLSNILSTPNKKVMKYIVISIFAAFCLCGNLFAQNMGTENNGREVGASAKAAPTEMPGEKTQADPKNVTDDRDIPGKAREPRTDIFLPEAIDELRDELYNSASVPQVVAEVEALKTVLLDIQATQEKLKYENELLRKQLSNCCSANAQDLTAEDAYLLQNAPNPFKVTTELNYFVPESAGDAQLEIHDLKGISLQSFDLTKGTGSIQLDSAQWPAGVYVYFLIIDKKMIDSKVMIVN